MFKEIRNSHVYFKDKLPSTYEPTWIAVKHHRKHAGKVGLYKSKEGMVCRGHKIGFEPTGPRPIIQGCVRCMEKINGI